MTRAEERRSATRDSLASRFELPLLGSNQDSPDPESGVLPVTPRGIGTKTITGGRFGLWKPEKRARYAVRGARLPPTINLRHYVRGAPRAVASDAGLAAAEIDVSPEATAHRVPRTG